jgi:hypothetical protein
VARRHSMRSMICVVRASVLTGLFFEELFRLKVRGHNPRCIELHVQVLSARSTTDRQTAAARNRMQRTWLLRITYNEADRTSIGIDTAVFSNAIVGHLVWHAEDDIHADSSKLTSSIIL